MNCLFSLFFPWTRVIFGGFISFIGQLKFRSGSIPHYFWTKFLISTWINSNSSLLQLGNYLSKHQKLRATDGLMLSAQDHAKSKVGQEDKMEELLEAVLLWDGKTWTDFEHLGFPPINIRKHHDTGLRQSGETTTTKPWTGYWSFQNYLIQMRV